MISLSAAVSVIVYILIAGMVFGLLLWLINYVSTQFPQIAPFAGVARVILAILAVLILIGLLVSLASGTPLFRA